MAYIEVNGKVLEWARNEAQMSQAEAAEALGLKPDELISYERGQLKPTLGVLRQMSAKYRLPVATLAMPEPFPRSKLPKDFRTFEGREPRVTPATAFAVREARRLQEGMQQLLAEDEDLAIPYTLPDVRRNILVAELATQERERLAVSVDTQLGWTNDGQAFRYWRDRIESLGIFVYMLEMPTDDCRGFTLREGENPVIVVSKEEKLDAAKTFTLLHEYCHIRRSETALSDLGWNPVEKYCNNFAAYVLMPEKALRRVLSLPQRPEVVDWEIGDIKSAARQLHVSQQALALRLENAGYAEDGFFEYVKSLQRVPEKKKKTKPSKGGVPPHVVRLAELGARYTGTVMAAYERGTLNDLEAYRMLDLAPKHFGKLRDRIGPRTAANAATKDLF